MALDRTWYNTLVDDDGSGLSGSVWDKADVNSLMNAIDAELARLGGTAAFWTPTIIGSGGGTPSYNLQTAWYERRGSLVWIGGRVSANKGTLSGQLSLGNLPVGTNGIIAQAGPRFGYVGGVTGNVPLACYAPGAGTSFALTYTNSGLLDASQISTLDLIFAGTYLAASS
jgi:hypothetical protein